MKILEGFESEYKNWLNKNKYVEGSTIAYTERWAKMLEDAVETSAGDIMKVLEDNALRLSFEADKEGITGYQYGCAVSILSQYWKYGSYLKQWHNKEYNYDGDCVVNPAIRRGSESRFMELLEIQKGASVADEY